MIQQQVIDNKTIVTFDKKLETLSDKYKLVETKLMKDKFESLGFKVDSFHQARVRKASKQGYQKHTVRMSNPTLLASVHKDCKLQLVLTNSHDGTSGFKMQLGIYRLVCANGMMAGSVFETINLRHIGSIEEKIEESVMRIVAQVGKLDDLMTKMKNVILTPKQQSEFLERAVKLRYDDKSLNDVEFVTRREEDKPLDAFTFMNMIQENLIRGGNNVRNSKGKIRAAKPITNITKSNLINTGIFDLALEYTEAVAA